jgi:uncharacterized protein (DUF1697 family)
MNLGRRRITNVDLCESLDGLGLKNVAAFLASGNVVFDADGTTAALEKRIENGLRESLDYEVPTFVRTAAELRAIAAHVPFAGSDGGQTPAGKLQVAMIRSKPSAGTRKTVLALSTAEDRVTIRGRELYWLPSGNLLDSSLDMRRIDDALGPMTNRTRRTIERMAAKFLEPGTSRAS